MFLFYSFTTLTMLGSDVIWHEQSHVESAVKIEDELQLSCIKAGHVYSAERAFGHENKERKLALMKIRLYILSLENDAINREGACFEMNDDEIFINSGTFLRWRLTGAKFFWGTQHGIGDRSSGIFRLPINILKPMVKNNTKKQREIERYPGLYNFIGGSRITTDVAVKSWLDRRGQETGIPARGLRGMLVDIKGIYFDFIPMRDERRIVLFMLFDNENLKFSKSERGKDSKSIIDLWQCDKDCEDRPFKEGTFDGSESLFDHIASLKNPSPIRGNNKGRERFTGWIDTDMSDPFYAFESREDYYFVTMSGRIYVAPHANVDPKEFESLVAVLDSGIFSTREKAMKDLRALGKPAQQSLEAYLSKPISLEQKRRITAILDDLKPLADRHTKLLWQDAKRPVNKLLFDQDKNKVYAFTKPNHDKQVYFFEIADKPQPRLFTGKVAPTSPASLPPSTRQFLEFARFVRGMK